MYLIYKKFIILLLLSFFYFQPKSIFELKHKEKPKSGFHIPIAFSINNLFTYPLIVSLTSILYNSKPSTLYYFYIMIPYGFLKENKQKIKSLCEKYKTCEIKFLNMGRKYKNWKTEPAYYAKSVYYRLSLSDLVTDFDKIIYLDCDTMVHSDLTNFYNIEMGDKCYMGFPGLEISRLEINGTRNFINSGVMLINLKMLRSVKASLLFSKYYYTYGTTKVDEYLINVIFYNRISFLPLEYGIPDFENGTTLIQSPSYFWNSFKGFLNGTEKEMISASNNRIITHGAFRYDKWWNRSYDSLSNIGKKWIYYASKSNVFNEICDIFIQYKTICSKIK